MYTSSLLSIFGLVTGAVAKGVWTTPHDKYSSSVGVLGCKINTNRVAYWPGSVDCDNICVKLSYEGRSVHLLRIDQSGGAHDISYDAWAYLQTGKSATSKPISGGSVAMEYEEVDASECADLIYTKGSKLPLSASNSMGFVSSCLSQPNSWVAKNHVLYNICDAICTLGHDEECTLDLATSNQPSCPHTLGLTSKLSSAPVYDVEYTSGKMVAAGSGKEAPKDVQIEETPKEEATEDTTTSSPSYDVPVEAPSEKSNPPATTSAPAVGAMGGVFHEVSSSIEVPEEPTTASPVEALPTSTPPNHESVTLEQSSAPTSVPTTMVIIPTSVSSNATVVPSASSSGFASHSSQAHTTLSSATVSPNPSTTPGTSPGGPPENAARPAAGVPLLGLGLGIAACALSSLF
jgi:hypothetical protein